MSGLWRPRSRSSGRPPCGVGGTLLGRLGEDPHDLNQHGGRNGFGGSLWYIEAVPDRGELIVIKQAELASVGQLHQYNWEHPEDGHGGLTDQAIDPEEDPLEVIPAEEFQWVWAR